MKTHASRRRLPRGFALIVTLSLMILLTVIAVGLLTLSSISLRTGAAGDAMNAARSNARLSLMLAIGDLQKQLGPDTRVSATADQIAGPNPDESAAPPAQRQWAGAYDSWPDAAPKDTRPAPSFLQWFVSGDTQNLTRRDYATSAITGTSVEIVTKNSVGATADPVRVPLLAQKLSTTGTNKSANGFAWWASDLNSKALIAPPREIPATFAEVRNDQQAAPANNIRAAKSGTAKPFALVTVNDERLQNTTTWKNAGLLSANPSDAIGLYHDFTTSSRGLLTNVRTGGFRKDLSMELERSNPPNSTATALYAVSGETGINLQELWAYYNLYKELGRGGANFTTGGRVPSDAPALTVESKVRGSSNSAESDDFFYFKQPVVISYQVALSFKIVGVTDQASGRQVNRLHLVADPIITLWNPLDVPVVIPTGAYLTVKYWQIPYSLSLSVDGGPFSPPFPLAASQSNASTTSNGDGNYLSLEFGNLQQLAFKPGEVIKISQPGNTIVKNTQPVDHALAGSSGFNYGGGVAVPVRDLSGKHFDLSPTSSIKYRMTPNNLTAGATNRDGHSITGGANHTRHFSLYHHELYIGSDRSSDSLGYGNMAIDWDFGNRRLKASENRGTSSPGAAGTKLSGSRLYADNPKLKDIFKSITNGRTMPFSALSASKQPFMLLSFNAKTEVSTDTGTRFLSRLNPNAAHVDFYDLSEAERDMLPYEFSVEELSSWKNRFLETSTNGNGFFGGGLDALDGTSFVTTHSVPREPLVSLGQFQYSCANGFDILRPKYGYGTLNAREPMLPQIAHAIGNSVACPVLAKDQVQGATSDGRPLADHSYLANQGLWDAWFLSGVSPQSKSTYARSRNQRTVFTDFLSGTANLPTVRYVPVLHGKAPAQLSNELFTGANPRPSATLDIASLMEVEGMFNVNSTSIEAWKSLLGGRDGRPIIVRDAGGAESMETGSADTPVAGLLAPLKGAISPGKGGVDPADQDQWVGRRVLNDTEIDLLARALVKQVRLRGPFLCLADFVNRRPGSNEDLARSGAIQSALDSPESGINAAYQANGRGFSATTAFAFPAAENGPRSYGSPGVVKQADILTPIAPIISARSDSFLIRAYGQKTDAAGNVIARAWCEATVRRTGDFVDTADLPSAPYASINKTNKNFGRRFEIVSFRWLNPSEA